MIRAMKLDVIESTEQQARPWYANGLRFTCSQCGNCCTGGPGYVWISDEEVARLAKKLRLSVEETLIRYCRRVGKRISLRESRNAQGLYDCVFLVEQRVERKLADGQTITTTLRTCTAYEARPLQCRTWPFWAENLEDEKAWRTAGRKCYGMGTGKEWSVEEIERIKNAKDWPDGAPTSNDS
jgi:Fe-S-cluster containining protein